MLGAVLLGWISVGCSLVHPMTTPGPEQTQSRTISAVSEVELASSGALVLTVGSPPALRITAGRNALDHLTSDIHGNRLTLDSDGTLGDFGRIRYDLVLPAARVFELSGSGSVQLPAPSALQQVLLPGSGDIRIDGLRTGVLTVDLSGSGQVTAAGSTGRQQVSISGSGRYAAEGLASQDAKVTISGSGSADVTASRTLTATVSGSGSVTYAGDAAVTSSITGSGDVVRR